MTNNKKNTSSSTKFVFYIIGFIAVCLIGFMFLGNHSKTDTKPVTKSSTGIDYTNQPYLGKESAPVSILEFGDYKCPNCKEFGENVIPIIKQELVDTGKAKLYFLNDSFINTDSIRSAKFAESVYNQLGNQIFWKFHDLLYKKQPTASKYEKMDVYNEEFLTDTLKEITNDANVAKVVAYFRANKADAAWQKDMDLASKLGVTGTPTLYVNGKLFDGKTLDDLTKMVDQVAKEKGNE